jgi:C4-dicarboxylate-specific signal transduction histidine kinase
MQLAVACYALRLIRVVKSARPALFISSAFALLSFVYVVHAGGPVGTGAVPAAFVILAWATIPVLLFIGLIRIEASLKARIQAEHAKAREEAEAEFATQLAEQTAKLTQANQELTAANDDLKRAADRLQTEIAERTNAQQQLEKTHREMMSVSRQAGMSEVATGVLHNVGNVLNSVNVSATLVADRLADFKINNLILVAKMMRDHAHDLGEFITKDPKGKQLPDYLGQLAGHLSSEQASLLKEINFVKTRIDHIKEIVATQQRYGRVVGVAERVKVPDLVEDVLRIHASELAQKEVQIQREYQSALPEMLLDKHKVLQILLNLLNNAKHACIESGVTEKRVTVSVTNGDDHLRITMRDNGIGISAANLKQIFNHGFTTRKKQGGHGFGLHSGALAAKEMGGTLTAVSDGSGTGAAFTLEIPIKRHSTGQPT